MARGDLNRRCHLRKMMQDHLETEKVLQALHSTPHPKLPNSGLSLYSYVHWCISNDAAVNAMHYVYDLRWRDNTPISEDGLRSMALGANADRDDRSYLNHEWRGKTWEEKLEWGLGEKPIDLEQGPPPEKQMPWQIELGQELYEALEEHERPFVDAAVKKGYEYCIEAKKSLNETVQNFGGYEETMDVAPEVLRESDYYKIASLLTSKYSLT